ncbi:methyltransferase [Microbacterium ginsengiterrae]
MSSLASVDFSFSALRRFPDVEAPNLQAWDATDELLVQRALAAGVSGDEIAVIGDEYGAITLALTDAGLRGIRVHQDLATGRRALAHNAAALSLGGFSSHELDASLLGGARLVLLQLPKALAELEEIVDAVARWAAPDVTLIAGGRVKHMTLTQNEVIGRSFEVVQPQRAERKSRLIVATGRRDAPAQPPFPVAAEVEVPGLSQPLTVVAHGGAFAGARLDIGTRVLLEALAAERTSGLGSQLRRNGQIPPSPRRNDADPHNSSGVVPGASTAPRHTSTSPTAASTTPGTVVDLGCGTGVLAATYALTHPDARIIATDRSAAAVASARATMRANGVDDRVTVTHDDAGSEIPDAAADLVLLNPPFHLGASVHTGAASRLFAAAARMLRPGGELLTVFNSSLGYRRELSATIGATEQVLRTPKFTVTRSVRR